MANVARLAGLIARMPRLLFCRFDDCREAYVSDAGKVPSICPACGRSAHWTTEAPTALIPAIDRQADPLREYVLTVNDRAFLRRTRIDPD